MTNRVSSLPVQDFGAFSKEKSKSKAIEMQN